MHEPSESKEEEPEFLQEFSSMTTEECQVAREKREELMQRFSAEILVKEQEGHPNKVTIWTYRQDSLEAATEFYIRACGNNPTSETHSQ